MNQMEQYNKVKSILLHRTAGLHQVRQSDLVQNFENEVLKKSEWRIKRRPEISYGSTCVLWVL